MKQRIVCFGGSNSSESINQKLIEYIAVNNSNIADFKIVNLRKHAAPLFGVDEFEENGIPQTIVELMEVLKTADALLISVAEHNGSITAALKSTFDWLSKLEGKFLLNKPTIFLSASPGARGGASALKHMLDIMPYRGADIKGSMAIGNFNDIFENQEFRDTEVYQSIVDLIKKELLN